ncbi:hypothetical protein F4777DRAFT_306889 [Nemania sp. FL0916]|nr:hypothetical protein F4777DRAFT_306889 [Nemania sp. FL0916]
MPPLPCANAPSAAKLFVQLSARSPSSTMLDVLLPTGPRMGMRMQTRALSASAVRSRGLPIPRPATSRSGRLGASESAAVRHRHDKQAFSISRSLGQTLAIHNPQRDEDGNDMMLEITPRAANRLSQIMTKDQNAYLALRIQVSSGGCHGFQYLMSLTTLPPTTPAPAGTETPLSALEVAEDVVPSTTTASAPTPAALGEDDTVFAFTNTDPDASGEALITSPKIVLDLPSLELLKGSKVDYTMELIGSQFKIVDNPLATSSCGCGTSFDIKV